MLSLMRLVPIPPGRIVSGEIILDGEDLLQLTEDQMRLGALFLLPTQAREAALRGSQRGLSQLFFVTFGIVVSLPVGNVILTEPSLRFSGWDYPTHWGPWCLRTEILSSMPGNSRSYREW